MPQIVNNNMNFDRLVNRLLEQNLGSRVSTGSEEVRNILKTGKVRSTGYGGDSYFVDKPEPKSQYFPMNVRDKKLGEKLGYVLRADRDKLEDPAYRMYKWLFKKEPTEQAIASSKDSFANRNYKVLPADAPSTDIKTIQRIVRDPKTGDWGFKTERDFNKFQQIYNKLQKAFETGKIKMRPPRITGPGAAGVASLMQFLNTEVPPDMKNSLISGGGLGIKGKFEAIP